MKGELWSLQQDNAPIHTADYTFSCVTENYVLVLEWPKRSLDLTTVEKVCNKVAKNVYGDEKRYENKGQSC